MTNSELIARINEEITEKYEGRRADERLFLLGVELGRFLEKNQIADVQLSFFTDQKEFNRQQEEVQVLVDQINTIAEHVLMSAALDHLSLHGEWSVGMGGMRTGSDFDDVVAERHGIQVSSIDQTFVDGDLRLELKLSGELANIFQRHRIPMGLSADVQTDACDYAEFSDESDLKRGLSGIRFDLGKREKNALQAVLNDLSKIYLFEITKKQHN